jgi:general secretion pathway protein A
VGEALTIRAPGAQTYEEYYGFAQSPFSLAPDPHFLYLSESHDEAIRQLLEAARRDEGVPDERVIVLTGEIGTGKTTIARALLTKLDNTSFASLILNPFLSVEELLHEVLLDFGVISPDVRTGRAIVASRQDLTRTLRDFLLALQPIGGRGVLIIDEAQHLPNEVLEQLRVISTAETDGRCLLQVMLIGQPSLLDVLAQDTLRELDSRVSVRATLRPLGRTDVEAYVAHRLSVAGAADRVKFEDGAIDAVYALSGGVPRLINLLCDRALMAGAFESTHSIDGATVYEAGRVLGMSVPAAATRSPSRRRQLVAFGTVLAVVAIAMASLRLAAAQPVLLPPVPAPPGVARAAALEARPLPAESDYPPDPPPPPVVSPTF